MSDEFLPGRHLGAGALNRLSESARSAHLGFAGFLATDNGSEQVPRNPRRMSSPNGFGSSRPRPFACRLAPDTAENAEEGDRALFCYLPPATADAIRWAGKAVSPAMNLGTKAKPWVNLGEPGEKLWLVLMFPEYSSTATVNGGPDATPTQWELSFDGTRSERRWPHLVAAIDGEIQQFHLGSLSLGGFGLTVTRGFVTQTVVSELVGGGYGIVNKRIFIKFANGLAVKTEDAPDEVVARLGACT